MKCSSLSVEDELDWTKGSGCDKLHDLNSLQEEALGERRSP